MLFQNKIKALFFKKYRKQIIRLKSRYKSYSKDEKNRLICILNHDIKTPLLAQIQAVKMVLNKKFGDINNDQAEILTEVLNSNNFMLGVVSNALFLMRYENEKPKLKLEKIDINNEILNCIEMIKDYADIKSQNITIKAKENIKITADKILIQKIILNLLTTAIDNGFEHSNIEVSLKENKREISFQAKSKSVYMTKNKLLSLFQEKKSLSDFNQLGMSLNLNIAEKLIKAHNWEIIIKSKKDNSSVFGFIAKK